MTPERAREVIENATEAYIELLKDNARLRAALDPFAKEAEHWNDIPGVYRCHDNVELWQNPNHQIKLCVGDLRNARAALTN